MARITRALVARREEYVYRQFVPVEDRKTPSVSQVNSDLAAHKDLGAKSENRPGGRRMNLRRIYQIRDAALHGFPAPSAPIPTAKPRKRRAA